MEDDLLITNKIINQNSESGLIIPMKKNERYTFFISSENRNKKKYPSLDSYSFKLLNPIKNIKVVKLLDAHISYMSAVNNSYILDWVYKKDKIIPFEKINSIDKINKYFNLSHILYGYTNGFDKNIPSILFNFKDKQTITISLFSDSLIKCDIFNVIDKNFPKLIKFISLEHNIIYECMLNNIEEFTDFQDTNLKNVYKLSVEPLTYKKTPFNTCSKNWGHILMYIYNPISKTILRFIPDNCYYLYKKKYFLKDLNSLIKTPEINNNEVFNINSEKLDILDILNNRYPELVKYTIYDIDIPIEKNTIYINNITGINNLIKQIEEIVTINNNNHFTWKFDNRDNRLLLQHFQICKNTLLAKDPTSYKIFIDLDLNTNDLIMIDNNYHLIYKNNLKPYFIANGCISNERTYKDVLVVTECVITSPSLTRDFHLNYSHKCYNNFKIIDSLDIIDGFLYNTSDYIVVKTKTRNSFKIGDIVVFSKENNALHNCSMKYIKHIEEKKDCVFITISLGYILENNKKGFIKYDLKGEINKISYKPWSYTNHDLILKIDSLNYIDILTDNTKDKAFAIINNTKVYGGDSHFETLTKLENINISFEGRRAINIKKSSLVFEVETESPN